MAGHHARLSNFLCQYVEFRVFGHYANIENDKLTPVDIGPP